jgi:multiple sugar transport system ATP-binding protein
MNFFEASVTNSGGHATFHSSNIEFTLNVDIPDGEYTLGVRPEDFVAEDAGEYINTVVDVVEPMGSDNFLYLETAGGSKEVVARVNSEYRPERGDKIALGFHTEDMHLFGPDGERVELNQLQRTESV